MEIKNPHDEAALVKARAEQEDPWVMYLIVRSSLEMSIGKTAAQIGHGVGILYEKYAKLVAAEFLCDFDNTEKLCDFENWQNNSFRKIVLRANEKQWRKLKESDELECHIVRDAGLTELDPGSETVIAIWPMKKSDRPKLLKRLQVLK